jgi:hypothetical protein
MPPRPFYFDYFWGRVSQFCPGQPGLWSSWVCSLWSWDGKYTSYTQLLVEMGVLLSFCLASNDGPSDLCLLSMIIGASHSTQPQTSFEMNNNYISLILKEVIYAVLILLKYFYFNFFCAHDLPYLLPTLCSLNEFLYTLNLLMSAWTYFLVFHYFRCLLLLNKLLQNPGAIISLGL